MDVNFWIIIMISASIGAWFVIEQIVKNFCEKNRQDASRYTTILYDLYAIFGGLIIAALDYSSVGIIYARVDTISIDLFYYTGLMGYFIYNLFKPVTLKYPEVFFHHIFVGIILLVAIIWGYPSVVLPIWFLIELNELIAQIRYLARNSKWKLQTIRMEFYVRVFNLCWVILLAIVGHTTKWIIEAPVVITGMYWLLSYYLIGMYLYEVSHYRRRSQKWIISTNLDNLDRSNTNTNQIEEIAS